MKDAQDEPLFVQRVAGLDIAKAGVEVTIRVPSDTTPGRRQQETRTFAATRAGLLSLADWLRCWGVTKLGMEATGDYWKPVFFLLESRGFDCELYNAAQVKALPGRPKTDRADSIWLAKIGKAAGTVAEDTASVLFGVEGLRVTDAEREADGSLTVWVVTDDPGAAACPDCGTVSRRVHEEVLTWPRDLRQGLREVTVAWCKRRWKCSSEGCSRVTFTESLPAIGSRCRLTSRLRGLLGAEVAERGCTVAEASRWQHVSWPVTHAAFAERADPVLAQPPAVVAHLGIDEHRRGRLTTQPGDTRRAGTPASIS
jgi:hypothetical protein